MPKMRKWENPEKKKQTILLNKTVLNKLKAYAVETDQSFDDVIKEPFARFEAELLDLSITIDHIRQQAIVDNIPKVPEEQPLLQ